MKRLCATAACLLGMAGLSPAAEPPQAEISNGQIRAKLYLPDAENGFYRATRFEWAGVMASLEFGGHKYFQPWFTRIDPAVRDFTYEGDNIIAGPISASMGPAEEFQQPLGYEAAKAGGTFLKIGVGVLRKRDDTAYNSMTPYAVADPGKWTVRKGGEFVTFVHEVADSPSGYAYAYTKTFRLTEGKPEMVVEHRIENRGRAPIRSQVSNHNFVVLDQESSGPDFEVTVPFAISSSRPPKGDFVEIRGNRVVYLKPFTPRDRVSFTIEGFGEDAKDFDIRIENRKAGAGMRMTGDRPLVGEEFWSIRNVLTVEPFVDVIAEPGKDFTWKYTYTYYTPREGK